MPGTIISLSFISLCLLCAINFWRPPVSLCLRREAPSNIKKIYTSRFSFIAYTIYFEFQYEHPTSPIPTKAWKAAASRERHNRGNPANTGLASSHFLTPCHWHPRYSVRSYWGPAHTPKCPLLLVLARSLSGLHLHNLTPYPPPRSTLLSKHSGMSCNTFFLKIIY